MPTLDEINAVRKEMGAKPLTQAGTVSTQPKTSLNDKLGLKFDKTSKEGLKQAFEKRGERYAEIENMDFTDGGESSVTPAYEALAKGARHISNFARGVYDVAKATPVVGDVMEGVEDASAYAVKKGVEKVGETKVGQATKYIADKIAPKEYRKEAGEKINEFISQPNIKEGLEATGDLLSGIGTVTGAVQTGKIATQGAKAVGKKLAQVVTPDTDDMIRKDLTQYTQQALSPRGAKTGDQMLKQTQQKVEGIQLLQKRANEIDIINEDGELVKFNPEKATMADTVQAVSKQKDAVVKRMSQQLKEAGEQGIKIDTTQTVDFLKDQAENGIDRETRKQAEDLLDDILEFQKRHGNDPEKLHEFIQLKNKKLAAKYSSGTVDPVSREAMDKLRQSMDEAVDRTAYGKEYGALLAIEKDIVREAQRLARQKGSGLEGFADTMGNLDLAMAVVTGNPAQAAKGLATKWFFNRLRSSKSPELMLQKAFKKAGELSKD